MDNASFIVMSPSHNLLNLIANIYKCALQKLAIRYRFFFFFYFSTFSLLFNVLLGEICLQTPEKSEASNMRGYSITEDGVQGE